MKAAIIIPARYASSRFPGKPLAMIAGQSLVERVYRRAAQCRAADAVYVATDDARIFEHVTSFDGNVVHTGEATTGTDRVAMALDEIERLDDVRFDQIINVQGDEPLVEIDSLERMIRTLQAEPVDIVTLACPLASEEEFRSPDVVKVVTDGSGNALYFSRSPIPSAFGPEARRHVGLYGFQASVLRKFAALKPSPLERNERLEQLRALENGYTIRVLETTAPHLGVDRPEDVARVEDELSRVHSETTEQ